MALALTQVYWQQWRRSLLSFRQRTNRGLRRDRSHNPTILSRCQIFDFKRVNNDDIVKNLKYVADQETITVDEDALFLIAEKSDGALLSKGINFLFRLASGLPEIPIILGTLGP